MQNDLAPIVLFVYNRPEHTKATLEALVKNELASKSVLYIYCDGAKVTSTTDQIYNIEIVRKLVKSQNWCGKTIIIERETNLGLAESIKTGVSEIVEKHGKVIVLEDDIVTSSQFLKFMNHALNLYQNSEEVMHISGYMFPIKSRLPATFFLKQATCWGWATWKRSWDRFTLLDPVKIKSKIIQTSKVTEFNLDNSLDFMQQLENNIFGIQKTWAVFWYATIFLNNGLSLHPGRSLTQNIGHDATGENCKPSNFYSIELAEDEISLNPIQITENQNVRRKLVEYFKKGEGSYRLKNKIRGFLKKFIVRFEKQRIAKIPRFNTFTTTLFFPFKIKAADSASFLFQYEEIFENQIYKFLPKSKTVKILDCGSNIGLSILYFKKYYPDSIIIGFECDKDIFDVLSYNIESNNLRDISLIQKAVWIEETEISFLSDMADGGRLDFHGSNISAPKVNAVRLRDYLHEKIDFLKIDIEGAEIDVLNDCKDLLTNVSILFVEYHSFVDRPQRINELFDILESNGLRYYVSHIGVTSKNPFSKIEYWGNMDNQLNIFAYRQ